MIISLVVAIGPKFQIGLNNQMPWRLSEDLKNFKKTTMGHHVLMGRKTFESIGKALPGRTNLILSHQKDFQAPGCQVVSSIDEAAQIAKMADESELMVIGGAEIYKVALPLATRIYLSQVEYHGDADAFFPQLNFSKWKVVKEEKHPKDSPPWTFKVMEK